MDYNLHDHQADTDAKHDAALDAAREAVEILPWELYEQLPFLTDAQLLQFCEVVVRTSDQEMRQMVRLICADVIENKARQMVEVRHG